MEVKFTEDVNTMNYGRRKKNAVVKVSEADGKAFIKNGVAVSAKGTSTKTEKEVK